MNLITAILLVACLQVSARAYPQITLSENNVPLQKVFQKIQQQSGYDFVCTYEILEQAGKVSVNVEDVSLQKALEACLKGKPLTYVIIGKTVVVQNKEKDYYTTTNIIAPEIPPPPIEIHGRVVNGNGEPLQNASVLISGTAIGTATNSEGRFTLTAPNNKNIVLEISSVGYQTKKVDVGKQTEINVTLELEVSGLNDVVVIGYGTVKRKDLTGSVASIKASDIVKSTDMSLNGTLQGRAAGVSVVSSDGAPGGDVSIYIRAGSSISASNDPLYVIDGFPQLGGSNLNINPNDVASVEILKDASATAIYGSRGANGVIIITTKTGKAGKFSINYDGYYSIQKLGNKLKVMNVLQYAQVQHYLWARPFNSELGDSTWYNWKDYKDSVGHDWQDELYRLGPMHSHNLSFSGGVSNLKMMGSLNYTNQDGIARGTNYQRYSARLNAIANINKVITYTGDMAITYQDKTGGSLSGGTGLAYSALKASPYIPDNQNYNEFLLASGITPGGTFGTDPLVELLGPDVKHLGYYVSLNSALSFKIMEGLVFKISGGMNYTGNAYNYFYDSKTSTGHLRNGVANKENSVYLGLINENTLNFTRNIGASGRIDAVGGFSFQKSTSTYTGVGISDFAIQALGYNSLGFGSQLQVPQSTKEVTGLVSYFGRVQYGYADKYLFTGTIRADGSSKFPIHKWGYFPSGGVAWRVDQEKFMSGITAVSTLKFRYTYGLTGNESVDPYSSYTKYGANTYPAVMNNQIVVGVYPSGLGSDALKWETTIQQNLGLDLGLFNDRILVTADIYQKKSKDLLLQAPLSTYSGFNSVTRNVGDMQVKGMEIALNTVNVNGKKFKWNTNFNISFNRSKVLSLNEGQTFFYTGRVDRYSNAYIVQVGKPLGSIYGYVFDGYINTQEELAATPATSLPIAVGTRKYKDISGKDGKPDGIVNSLDQTVIGNGNPKFFGGFTNDFSYGPFELSVLFTYSYGNDILNSEKYQLEMPLEVLGGPVSMFKRWTPLTPQVNGQRWNSSYDPEYSSLTSYVIEDGSYLRLKNLQVAYNFGQRLLQKASIKSLRLYFTAQNLLTFTHYTGYDPEVNFLNSIITPGADVSSYPRNKIYTIGINLSF